MRQRAGLTCGDTLTLLPAGQARALKAHALATLSRDAGEGFQLPEHAAFGREAHQHLADGLEMNGAALALLGSGVDVAHPAF